MTSRSRVAGVYAPMSGLGRGAPSVPTLTYGSSEGHFTITNYVAGLTYTVTGATRSGSDISSVSSGATITAAYAPGAPVSAARTMYVASHGRVLDAIQQGLSSAGCGTRPQQCCPNGWIVGTDGNTCLSGGTLGAFAECGGSCPGNCYGYFGSCWSWHWTDYSGSGYTLIGNTWGKSA